MLGIFDEKQIDDLLKSQLIGRIGCHTDGITYIVPVNYVFDGSCIYAHSAEGMKVKMLRKNPNVCFEVDAITDMFNWQSAIVWGMFQELTEVTEQIRAMQLINDGMQPFLKDMRSHPSHGITEEASDIGTKKDLVIYKITPIRKSGRFEMTVDGDQIQGEK